MIFNIQAANIKGEYILKKRFTILIAAALTIMLSACGETPIKFGTSPEGGTYGEVAKAIDSVSAENFEIRNTAGSAANVRLLSQGYLDMAITQSDVLDNAYKGTGMFEGKQRTGYKAVAGLYTEACQVIVKADSGINAIDELTGKRVGIGEKESGSEQNSKQILLAYGLTDNMLTEVNLNYVQECDQLKSGEIDAFFCTLAPSSPVLTKLAEECDIKLLPIDGRYAENLIKTYGFYTACKIPANMYKGVSEDVETIGVTAVLLASDYMPAQKVQAVTEAIFKNSDAINSAVSTDIHPDEQSAIKGISIPFHPGAAQYYKSHGITVEQEEEQQ